MRVRSPREWSDAAVEWLVAGVLTSASILMLAVVAC
jgi:hypothetical protein